MIPEPMIPKPMTSKLRAKLFGMYERFILPAALFVALLGLWELASRREWIDPFFFSSPVAIVEYLLAGFRDGSLLSAIRVTCIRLAIGFSVGLVIGIPLGILVSWSPFARRTIGVVALGFQALPSVCWVPLALLWFGQTEAAVLFVVCMGTVWSVVIAVSDAVRSIPPIYNRAARTMGAKGFALLWKVTIPASLPVVLNGMKQGWAFAWRSLLAAEIFVTIISGFGLGQLLHYGRELHAMDQVYGVMLVVVTIGLATELLIFGTLRRRLARRWGLLAL